MCTDAGADQVYARSSIRQHVSDCTNILFFDYSCVVHQFHLTVKYGLILTDECLKQVHAHLPAGNLHVKHYFGSLAKTSNTWRSHAVAVSKQWDIDNGALLSAKGRKIPQHCLVGRFGSVDGTEAHYIDLGQERVTKCLVTTLMHRLPNRVPKTKRKREGQLDDDDDGANVQEGAQENAPVNVQGAEQGIVSDPLDEVKEYRLKMTKWRTATVDACKCSIFWYLIHLCNWARAPLRHYYHWIMKSDKDIPTLLGLATGKALSFMSEFDKMLGELPTVVESVLLSSGCTASLNIQAQAQLKLLALRVFTGQCASFWRRLVAPVLM